MSDELIDHIKRDLSDPATCDILAEEWFREAVDILLAAIRERDRRIAELEQALRDHDLVTRFEEMLDSGAAPPEIRNELSTESLRAIRQSLSEHQRGESTPLDPSSLP